MVPFLLFYRMCTMGEIDEQKQKVENLKKKILEQKRKAGNSSAIEESELEEETQVSARKQELSDESARPKSTKTDIRKEEEERLKALADAKKQVEKAAQKRNLRETSDEKVEDLNQSSSQETGIEASAQSFYKKVLRKVLSVEGVEPNGKKVLGVIRNLLGISEREQSDLLQEIHLEIYYDAILDSWKDGSVSYEDSERLESLREIFGISADEHFRLEKQVRQELIKKKE